MKTKITRRVAVKGMGAAAVAAGTLGMPAILRRRPSVKIGFLTPHHRRRGAPRQDAAQLLRAGDGRHPRGRRHRRRQAARIPRRGRSRPTPRRHRQDAQADLAGQSRMP